MPGGTEQQIDRSTFAIDITGRLHWVIILWDRTAVARTSSWSFAKPAKGAIGTIIPTHRGLIGPQQQLHLSLGLWRSQSGQRKGSRRAQAEVRDEAAMQPPSEEMTWPAAMELGGEQARWMMYTPARASPYLTRR